MELLLGIKMETIGFILQTLGSLLLLGGYAPQIIKLHRTKIPTGISLLFWTMVGIGCTAINVNMIISNAPFEVILTQSLNMIGAWYTLFLVIYCRKLHGMPIKINKTIGLIASFLAGTMVYQIQVLPMAQVGIMFQTIGTVALLTAYIPQIVYLHKVKDATGISRWLFIVIASGLLMVTVNMIISKVNIEIIITEFVNIALILVQYVLTVYYQSKNK